MHKEYIRISEKADTAVLMLHGIIGSPYHFKDFVPIVPEGVDIYNLLLPGHGGGVSDFSRSSMAEWKKYVSGKLSEISGKYESVIILAHSMGTLFAIDGAINNMSVKRLFLIDSPMKAKFGIRAIYTCMKVLFGKNLSAKLLAAKNDTSITLSKNLFKYIPWAPRYLELFGEIRRTRGKIGKIKIPTSVFQSGLDELVSKKSAGYFEGYDNISVTTLPNSGHFYYPQDELKIMTEAFKSIFE